ncbi:MAG: TIGR02221 family CRISPR-associated protein [Brevinematales bacterium]
MNNNRKVFLSFLGTNDYVECNYYFGNQKVENVKFVQEAMLKIFCKEFKKDNNDKIYILLTKEAEDRNWPKLEEKISELKKNDIVEPVKDIPVGSNENEIWQIFSKVFNLFKDGDEVFFDITHGFRLLPLLGITLLNYARFLKNIKIKGIYYGAFETLGPISLVRQRDIKDRNAPIFDLTPYYDIMEWGIGAREFVSSGSTRKIKEIVNQHIIPLQKTFCGKIDDNYKKIKHLIDWIDIGTNEILYCRGLQIIKGENFNKAKKLLNEIKRADLNLSYALIPLLEKIEEKITEFNSDDILNGFRAVKWCIEHNLIQQGITILQEMLITYLIEKTKYKDKINNKKIREELSAAIYFVMNPNINEKEYKGDNDILEILKKMKENNDIKELFNIFNRLRNIRNDINHCGFIQPIKIEKLKKELENSFNEVYKVVLNDK